MFILKKGHRPGVYVPLRALFLVFCKFATELWPLIDVFFNIFIQYFV